MKRRVWAGALWALSALWLGLCFFLSWQTGEDTAATSRWLADALLGILARWGKSPDPEAFHLFLRTWAHWVAFLVAGALVTGAAALTRWEKPRPARRALLGGVAICLVSACASEMFKVCVPGRHLQWDELGLNLLGAAMGIAPVCFAAWLLDRKRSTPYNGSNTQERGRSS